MYCSEFWGVLVQRPKCLHPCGAISGLGLRYQNMFQTRFLPLSFRLWAEVQVLGL